MATKPFNRWLVPVGAVAVHVCIGSVYAWSTFNRPIKAVFPNDPWWFSPPYTTFTMALVLLGLSAALAGPWVERRGPRMAATAAALFFGSGLLIGGIGLLIRQSILVFLGMGLIGGIGCGLGYISPVSTLVKCFPDRRGMATGMAIMGFGGGAFLAGYLNVYLIGQLGVGRTIMVLGAIYLVVMLLGAQLLRRPPAGWAQSSDIATDRSINRNVAIRTVQFFLLWGILFINVTAGIGILSQASPMMQDLFQKTAAAAAGVVSLVSIFNAAGRFFWASSSDYLGRRNTYLIFFATQLILFLLIPRLAASGNWIMFEASLFVVFTMYGGGFATIPAFLADLFGSENVGAIHGALLTAWSAAAVVGPVIITELSNRAKAALVPGASKVHIYDTPLQVLAVLLAIGFALTLLVRPMPKTAALAGLLVLSTLCSAQDREEALAKIRDRVLDGMKRVPNYLCTETVEREILRLADVPPGNSLACWGVLRLAHSLVPRTEPLSSDRLRIDVGMVSKGEIYSWVGERQFGEKPLEELVTDGAVSSGAFGSYLNSIFRPGKATFTFEGDSELNGRRVLTYKYRVAVKNSGYFIFRGKIKVLVGFSGSFAADAATFELLRLELNSDPPPPELQLCEVSNTLEFGTVKLNNVDFQLPSEVRTRMLSDDGMLNNSRTVFRACQQFHGESKLIFDDQSADDSAKEAIRATVHLAPGLRFTAALTGSIDPAKAAAGDPIEGKLTKPIKDQSSRVTIPKGTRLQGRIVQVRISRAFQKSLLELGLKWESLDFEGVRYAFDLKVKALSSFSAATASSERGAGFFVFPGYAKDFQVPAGFEVEWVTVASK